MQQIQSKVTLVDTCEFSRSSSFTNALNLFSFALLILILVLEKAPQLEHGKQ